MNTDNDRSSWAEQLDSFGPDARLTSGSAAAAHGRAALEAALGGAEGVEKALRGRPSLASEQKARGYQSPKRTFRLTEDLDQQLATFVTAKQRPQSDVMRDALSEYFERHAG